MAHYDLYNSIGLDRSKDPATLAAELDERINSGVATNPGGMEELKIARGILGDAQRRTLYDQKLADTNAPDINIAALRDLANADFGGAQAGAPAGAPAGAAAGAAFPGGGQDGATSVKVSPAGDGEKGPSALDRGRESFNKAKENLTPAMEKTRAEYARSSKGIIAATAVATALVMLLIWGLFAAFGGDSGERKAKAITNEFLQLRTNEETERWLIDNAAGESRAAIIDELEVGDGYTGVDNYFGASEPKAGEVMNFKDFAKIYSRYDEDAYYRALSRLGMDDAYLVQVNNSNGSDAGGTVIAFIEGGKAKVGYLEEGLPDIDSELSDIDSLF